VFSGDIEEVAFLSIPVGVTDLSVASLVEDQVASARLRNGEVVVKMGTAYSVWW
jgi:hypothetical protein